MPSRAVFVKALGAGFAAGVAAINSSALFSHAFTLKGLYASLATAGMTAVAVFLRNLTPTTTSAA